MLQPAKPARPLASPAGAFPRALARLAPAALSRPEPRAPSHRVAPFAGVAAALLGAWRGRRSAASRSAAAPRTPARGAAPGGVPWRGAASPASGAEAPAEGGDRRRAALLAALLLGAGRPAPAPADDKLRGLAPEKLAEIIEEDVSKRAFMVSADLTRAVYDEGCTFTDEIDTYEIDKFIKGTKALFLGPPYSKLELTSPVTATASDVRFTFSEDLVFNIPFKPVVSLTGRMEMKRGPDGLITSYREYWDGGVPGVLRTVRLSGF